MTTMRYYFILIVLILVCLTLYSARALYVDGAYYFLNIIQNGYFAFFEPSRAYVHMISQSLPVFFYRAGVYNINILISAYTFSLHVVPLLVWGYSVLLIKRETGVFVGLFSVIYLNAAFFHGEYILTYALVFFIYSVINMVHKPESKRPFVLCLIAVLAAMILIKSYEAMSFLAPLLILASIIRYRSSDEKNHVFLILIIALSLLATTVSIYYISNSRHTNPASSLIDGRIFQNKQLIFTLIAYSLYYLGAQLAKINSRFRSRYYKPIIILSLIPLSLLLLPSNWQTPYQSHEIRLFIGFALFFYLLVDIFLTLYIAKQSTHVSNQRILPFEGLVPISMLTILAVAMSFHIINYRSYLADFELFVNQHTGVIPEEEFPGRSSIYTGLWTNPSLSILLNCSSRPSQMGIITPPKDYFWQPFPPDNFTPRNPAIYKNNFLIADNSSACP